MWVWPLSALVWNDKVGQCFMLKFCGVIIVPIPTNCLQKRIWQQVDMDQTCRNWIPVRGLNSMPQMIRTRKNCCFRSESKVDPFRRRWFLQFPPKKKNKNGSAKWPNVGVLRESHLHDGMFGFPLHPAPQGDHAVRNAQSFHGRGTDDAVPCTVGIAAIPDVGSIGDRLIPRIAKCYFHLLQWCTRFCTKVSGNEPSDVKIPIDYPGFHSFQRTMRSKRGPGWEFQATGCCGDASIWLRAVVVPSRKWSSHPSKIDSTSTCFPYFSKSPSAKAPFSLPSFKPRFPASRCIVTWAVSNT